MERAARRWKPQPCPPGTPLRLRPWLTDAGSLTARIKTRCDQLKVRVLRQGMELPNEDERGMVGLRQGRHAWVREVLLLADDRPVVFAHSILAPDSRRGAWRLATAMGGRPLGAALFADPRIRRDPLHVAALAKGHPLHRRTETALGIQLPTLWARRSRFMRQGRLLLVTEVFLPDLAALG